MKRKRSISWGIFSITGSSIGGFTRFLGEIARISDSGVKVNFFTGNHDVWVFDYLPVEIGVEVFRHVGFFPLEEVEKQLAPMGVK